MNVPLKENLREGTPIPVDPLLNIPCYAHLFHKKILHGILMMNTLLRKLV